MMMRIEFYAGEQDQEPIVMALPFVPRGGENVTLPTEQRYRLVERVGYVLEKGGFYVTVELGEPGGS